ncbi:uncharacterized protein LOC141595992 [Silene latifolia]|uniref:uncharacterized protein LOC141595992 n=1 Tax=Silene latifolia TaxID=37657 RepID=UPI003D76D97F
MARKDKDTKKPEPPPPPSPEPTNNSESGSEAEDSDSDVVSSSSSDAAPPTTTTLPTTVKRTLTPHHHHSQPEPESESESESDDDTPPPPPPPKPTTTTKQPRSKPPTPKRPAQSDNSSKGSEKRPKKDSSSTGPSATTSATPGKVLFQRLWSDEDEIVILKGMIEYKEKKGVDPMTHVDDFLDFIKKSLHVADANKAQIMSKVRRLKKRFINAQKKKLTDPHEITAFELSKKIWRGVEEVDEVNHRENGVTVAVAALKEEEKNVGGLGNGEVELGFLGAEGEMVKTAMRIMGDRERKEMRRLVEKANAAHWDAYLLRLKVLDVAAKKFVEGIRNDRC